jgi:hypothetical protein
MTLLAILHWVRKNPTVSIGVVVAIALAAAVVGHQWHVQRRTDQRTTIVVDSVYKAAKEAAQLVWPIERKRWRFLEDSLRHANAQLDANLTKSLARVKRLLASANSQGTPTPPASTPTVQVEPPSSGLSPLFVVSSAPLRLQAPSDSLRAACLSLANDCERYRANAIARHANDSTAIAAAAQREIVFQLGINQANAALARATKYRHIERGVCAASVGINLFTVLR